MSNQTPDNHTEALISKVRSLALAGETGLAINLITRYLQNNPDSQALIETAAELLVETKGDLGDHGWVSGDVLSRQARLDALHKEENRLRSEKAGSGGIQSTQGKAGSERVRVKSPIFVIGCGRSGTALLYNLLSEHPAIRGTPGYPDGEDHVGWIEHGQCVISGLGATPEIDKGHSGYHYCPHMTEWDVTEDIIDAMHAHYHANVLFGNSSLRAINKCAHLSNKLRYVRQIFPDAKFIHIVRDAAPVVSSWIKEMELQRHQMLYWPETEYPCFWVLPKPTDDTALRVLSRDKHFYPAGGALFFAEYWAVVNSYIAPQLEDTPGQLHVVRYEDILENPISTINEIHEFLNLPPVERIKLNIKADNNEKFRRHLGRDHISGIEQYTHAVRKRYGYI